MEKLQDIIKSVEYKNMPHGRTQWEFYPSEASFINKNGTVIGKCLRECYYKWLQMPPTNDLSSHVINTIIWGIGIEDHIIRGFKKAGILINSQVSYKAKITEDMTLSMRLDAIVKRNNQNIFVEIKTYEGEPKYIKERPKEAHLIQAFLYLVTFRPKFPYGIIYYRQRPGHRFAETRDIEHRIDSVTLNGLTYPVINGKLYDKINYEDIIKRYQKLKKYMQVKVLPPRDFSGKARQCSYRMLLS